MCGAAAVLPYYFPAASPAAGLLHVPGRPAEARGQRVATPVKTVSGLSRLAPAAEPILSLLRLRQRANDSLSLALGLGQA